ncbi:MAG: hypothetical protein ACXVR1_13025 [Solirubrobacteraceae bacterium]
MKPIRRGATLALVAASMAGGAVGATVLSAASSNAATSSTPSTTGTATQGGAPGAPDAPNGAPPRSSADGKFHSNENPAHEKTESAQREAQETAGQFPTVK